MGRSVDWMFRLIDRVTAPARKIDARLEAVEKTIKRVENAARVSGGAFGGWARKGEQAAGRVERAYAKVERRVMATHRSAQGMFQMLQTGGLVLGGLGAGAGYALSKVLGGMGQREGDLMSLSTLLKTNNMARVRSAAGWINRFADVTPFEDKDVMGSVRQLLAAQFRFPQVQGIARITGDAASALGSDPNDAAFKWEIINRALGQIKAKGRVQGDEILQLNEAGIGTDAYLKRYVGANYRQMMEKGQLSASAGISAILRGLQDDFGGSMDKMSKTFMGLWSTLRSRPQRVLGTLFDNGALAQPKRFIQNLVDLTDFSKPPGSKVLARLTVTGKRIMDGLFGPLADATSGQQGIDTIDRLLDKLDETAAWWSRNGPGIVANARGFGEGLKAAGDGAATLIRPLTWILEQVDRASGGSGQGMLGKLLGLGVGAVALGKLGNMLTFGLLGKVGAKAGPMLFGGLKTGVTGIARGLATRFMGAWGLAALSKSAASVGWLRALGLGEVAAVGSKAIPVIGTIIAAVTILKGLGDQLYDHWKGFADLIDGIKGKLDWALKPADQQTSFIGRAMAFDPIKWATGKPQAWEQANGSFMDGLGGVAGRLGVNATDLLKVMNLESGLNPAALNTRSRAAGLIQFLPSTAQELGTSTSALRGMTREQQLPYVEAYLKAHGVRPGMGLEQLYMSVLSGNAGNTGALWTSGTDAYTQNAGLDTNKDGVITTTEATQKVESAWQRDKGKVEVQLNQHFYANPDAATVAAAGTSTTQTLDAWAREHGFGGTAP